MYTIAFITDLHFSRGHNEYPEGVDGKDNFKSVLKQSLSYHPDHLIIGGDYDFREPLKETPTILKKMVAEAELPYDVIAGNHDDPLMVRNVFYPGLRQEITGELFFSKILDNRLCLFLDTADGYLSDHQLAWLQEKLEDYADDFPPLIFMHHPPVLCDAPHMDDNYPLQSREEFSKVITKYGKKVFVFCGHYHMEKIIVSDLIHCFITPSCFLQIDTRYKKFVEHHRRPAFRIIQWDKNQFYTYVIYHDL